MDNLKEKKSFIFYNNWINLFELLDDNQAGLLIKHILEYVNGKDSEVKNLLVKGYFVMIKDTIDRDFEKYEKYLKKQSENGKKGGRPKKIDNQEVNKKPTLNKETQKTQPFFKKPKKADSDSVSVSVSVSDNVNENKKEKKYIKKDLKGLEKAYAKKSISEIKFMLRDDFNVNPKGEITEETYMLIHKTINYLFKNNCKIDNLNSNTKAFIGYHFSERDDNGNLIYNNGMLFKMLQKYYAKDIDNGNICNPFYFLKLENLLNFSKDNYYPLDYPAKKDKDFYVKNRNWIIKNIVIVRDTKIYKETGKEFYKAIPSDVFDDMYEEYGIKGGGGTVRSIPDTYQEFLHRNIMSESDWENKFYFSSGAIYDIKSSYYQQKAEQKRLINT